MAKIVRVRAYANNEVAYVAWDIDGMIPGCLGFEVTRVYLNHDGTEAVVGGKPDRVRCATWVGFKGQRNPRWLPEDTGIWPVQKLCWRDLTLRKKRAGLARRPDEVFVRYEVRALGDLQPGRTPAPDPAPYRAKVAKLDAAGKPVKGPDGKPVKVEVPSYTGTPRPLGYIGKAVASNDIRVTSRRGPFRSTFTNGILAAQWLRNVLLEDGTIEPDELLNKISDPDDPHRKYLAGDVLPLLHELFGRKGEFYLGLYELEDRELQDLLLDNKNRIHVILSNTSAENKLWDKRNSKARKELADAGVDIQHRMFNNATHIGHNKFVVHVGTDGRAAAVLTGSTNWTSTGVAGQTNNALLIDHPDVADAFLDYWKRMKADALTLPEPLGAPMSASRQGLPFRTANATKVSAPLGTGTTVTAWYSPNMPERTKTKKVPPDLTDVYRRMRLAKDAILFLAFYPAQRGTDCIIGEAIDIGLKDRSLIVAGAVSSPQAMPNYVPKKKNDPDDPDDDVPSTSPHTFRDGNVEIVRASRIEDRDLLKDFGMEQLTAKGSVGAIIHDKVMVIDPLSHDCTVILGSHNLGFKASYSNDENMLIVSGDRALAEAYAVHILDVYDHYRFRAIEAERKRQGKKGWSGFLETTDAWLEPYADGRKGAVMRYFAKG